MTNQRPHDDRYGQDSSDETRNALLDSDLQPDPELAEGPASGTRIALFAVAIALVLGAVFYGLNNTSTNSSGGSTAQTSPANQSTAQTSTPVPPGVRDVTPRNNTAPGVTTGAAPAQPQQPSGTGSPPPAK